MRKACASVQNPLAQVPIVQSIEQGMSHQMFRRLELGFAFVQCARADTDTQLICQGLGRKLGMVLEQIQNFFPSLLQAFPLAFFLNCPNPSFAPAGTSAPHNRPAPPHWAAASWLPASAWPSSGCRGPTSQSDPGGGRLWLSTGSRVWTHGVEKAFPGPTQNAVRQGK